MNRALRSRVAIWAGAAVAVSLVSGAVVAVTMETTAADDDAVAVVAPASSDPAPDSPPEADDGTRLPGPDEEPATAASEDVTSIDDGDDAESTDGAPNATHGEPASTDGEDTEPPPEPDMEDPVASEAPVVEFVVGGQAPPDAGATRFDAGDGSAPFDFASNRLIVAGPDEQQLADFLAEHPGRVVDTTSVAGTVVVTVEMEVTPRDVEHAAERLVAALDADQPSGTTVSVSDGTGFGLIGLAALASTQGLDATVDFAISPAGEADDAVATGTATEGWTWNGSSDPFQWDYFRDGGVLDIGVTEAWRRLRAVGRLTPGSVDIAVIDQGFDLTIPDLADATLYPADASGRAGSAVCGGNPCPFHGSTVAQIAAGDLNDTLGTVGPGGPIADLTLIDLNAIADDAWSNFRLTEFIGAFELLGTTNPDVINMSGASEIPWYVAWVVDPVAGLFADLAEGHNIVLVASAGNDGRNIDYHGDCLLGTCPWENEIVFPCEVRHVLCVGGLSKGSTNGHPNSNYGREDVDIYAPYEHANDGSGPNRGTSYSAPFVAGIVGLMRAAWPDMPAENVRRLLADTAHEAGGIRIVDAGAALARIAHAGKADIDVHSLELISPDVQIGADGVRLEAAINGFTLGDARIKLYDGDDRLAGQELLHPQVVWTIDGKLHEIGNPGALNPLDLGPGTYLVAAELTDLAGTVHRAERRVSVLDHGPTVRLETDGPITIDEGLDLSMRGEVRGRFSVPTAEWRLDGVLIDAASTAVGEPNRFSLTTVRVPAALLTPGRHLLELTARQAPGVFSTDSVLVDVVAGPEPDENGNTPPVLQVLGDDDTWSPGGYSHVITIRATDAEDGDVTDSVRWWVECAGGAVLEVHPERLGSGRFGIEAPGDGFPGCGTSRHAVTAATNGYRMWLTVTDTGGATATSPDHWLVTGVVVR